MKSLTAILVLCFAIYACGCKPKVREAEAMRAGEVFVVLKSDEVRALADIEVIGFDKSFGTRFAEWQSKWNTELSRPKPIQLSADWQDKLNRLDRSIESNLSRTNTTDLELEARSNLSFATNIPLEMEKVRGQILAQASNLERLKKEQTQLAEQEMKIQALAQARAECVKSFAAFISSNAVYSTRTGSKGDFQIPVNISFVFAGTVRPNTGEAPCWLVKVDPQQKLIRLSNSNLAAKDDTDELWMMRCTP